MNKTVRFIRIGVPLLAAAIFCFWLRRQYNILSLGTVSALISISLFTVTLVAALSRLARSMADREPPLIASPDTASERLSAWGMLLLFGCTVSIFQFIAVYLLSGTDMDFVFSFSRLYYRSDVAHYMGIARDWYVLDGEERFRLVFLPLYSLVVRMLTWNGDYFYGSFLTAQLFSLACLPAAYELFRLDMDRCSAKACARLLFLLPGAAFLRIPMSEGLFLFLTLLGVYFARKQRFLLAGLFTALSAFTRSLGILLLGLLFLEMLFVFLDEHQQSGREAFRMLPKYIGCLLLGCCGTLAYLLINWQVSGDPFTFLAYQRENWTQQLGFFFDTAAYQAEYARTYWLEGDLEAMLSLSLPNLVCCFAALLLLLTDRDRMRISYLLWALVYFSVSIGVTWLLSGPRYLAMLFPLAPVLRRLCKGTIRELILEATLLFLQTGYLFMLALDLYVY